METLTSSLVARTNSLYDTPRFRKFRSEFRAEIEVDTDKSNSARKALSHSAGPQEIEISSLGYITEYKRDYVLD